VGRECFEKAELVDISGAKTFSESIDIYRWDFRWSVKWAENSSAFMIAKMFSEMGSG